MDDAIRLLMQQEIAKGTKLDAVQTLVNQKFGTKYTFMEIRIMASELAVDWSDPADRKPAPQAEAPAAEPVKAGAGEAAAAPGTTVLEINKVNPPGVMLSGSVTFASGATAEWMIDSYGRCGLDKVNGKPTEEDLKAFQSELQKKLGGM